MPIYVLIPNITGAVTATGYVGCHELASLTWGETVAVSANNTLGKTTSSSVVVQKALSRGSTALFQDCAKVQRFDPITISIIASQGLLSKIVLNNCYIVNYQISAESDGNVYEQMSIIFGKMTYEFVRADKTTETTDWNFMTNSP